jgi:hypothetical protein
MNKLICTLALTLIPTLANASLTGAQATEAKAVLASPEIAALLNVEKKAHNLGCAKADLSDVTINPDADMDAFEIIYVCNDIKYGANVHRIHFTGGTYTASPTASTAEVIVTGMLVELSE